MFEVKNNCYNFLKEENIFKKLYNLDVIDVKINFFIFIWYLKKNKNKDGVKIRE